jgi:hypothetical protein
MINIVSIGKADYKAKKISAWIVGGLIDDLAFKKTYPIAGRQILVSAEPMWPECKMPKPRCDVVLIASLEEKDLIGIDELVKDYMTVPVKFIVYEGAAPPKEKEKEWGAAALQMQDPQVLIEKLRKAHDELAALVKNIFEEFDKDKRGYIDLKDLTQVAKELGVLLSPAEAELMYKELDENKDGKISLKEFTDWWRNGRQGKSYKLSEMLTKGIQKSKALSLAANLLEQYGGLKDLVEEEQKVIKSQFEIHVNRVKNVGGLILNGMFMSPGKALDAHLQQYRTCLSFPTNSTFFAMAFGCKKAPQQVLENLKDILEKILTIDKGLKRLSTDFPREYGISTNKKVILGAMLPENALMIDVALKNLAKAFPNFKVEQTLSVFVKFATDLAKLSTEDRSALDMLLFDGVSVDLEFQILQAFASKVATMGDQAKKFLGQMGNVAQLIQENGMYANSVTGELEFDVNQELRAKVADIVGESNPLNTPLKIFKGMFAPILKKKIEKMPILGKAKDFLMDDIENVEMFFYLDGKMAVKVYAELPGLKTLLDF